MKKGRFKRSSFLLVLLSIMVFALQSSTFAAEIIPLGEVASIGKAEVMTSTGTWSAIDKVYPVFSETTYRTEKGGLSFILNDGTRLEVGNYSGFYIAGEMGQYSARLEKGGIAFNIPKGTVLIIQTPDAVIEVPFDKRSSSISKVSSTEEQIIGAVIYDGKKTQVISVEGNIKIKGLVSGTDIRKLTPGKSVYIYPEGRGYKIMPAQAVGLAEAKTVDEKNWIVSGGVTLDEVSKLVGTRVKSEKTNHVGDFVKELLGETPKKGDVTKYKDLKFEVLELKGTNILLVQISKEKKLAALLFPGGADKIILGVTGAAMGGMVVYSVDRAQEEGKPASPHKPQ